MKTKKRRKKTKKIGTSLLLLAILLLPLALSAKKKPAASDAYAVIGGTVFQESGYALPDADVTLTPQAPPGDGSKKVEKMEAVSSPRGEFSFHVPPGPGQYTVSVSAKGYQSAQKSVSLEGRERKEVTFQLDRESK